MEQKGLWELISKIASPLLNEDNKPTTPTNNDNKNSDLKNSPTENTNPLFGSFSKSYNPFSAVEKEKKQILGLKAQKPPKTIIELKNSKPIDKSKNSDFNRDIIKLINNHNHHVNNNKKIWFV